MQNSYHKNGLAMWIKWFKLTFIHKFIIYHWIIICVNGSGKFFNKRHKRIDFYGKIIFMILDYNLLHDGLRPFGCFIFKLINEHYSMVLVIK